MKKSSGFSVSSAGLHILAMVAMLCDHLGMVLFPQVAWMRCVGRIAFPIFAFLLVEGFLHTRDFSKYAERLFFCAIIAEIPFDFMRSGYVIDPYHQNVLWTLLMALLTMRAIQENREGSKLAPVFVVIAEVIAAELARADYGGAGVLMVLVFYLFHENTPQNHAAQFLCLLILNAFVVPSGFISISGHEIRMQLFAMFALLPIWLYRGRQGYHGQEFRFFCYAFYPVHAFVLGYLRLVCCEAV